MPAAAPALGPALLARHRDRVADRRQRVAQLVSQHGEEFVLALIRLPQGLLGTPELADGALLGVLR